MIRGILIFLIMWASITGCLVLYSKLAKFEKMTLAKNIGFGGLTATLAFAILSAIVVVF